MTAPETLSGNKGFSVLQVLIGTWILIAVAFGVYKLTVFLINIAAHVNT